MLEGDVGAERADVDELLAVRREAGRMLAHQQRALADRAHAGDACLGDAHRAITIAPFLQVERASSLPRMALAAATPGDPTDGLPLPSRTPPTTRRRTARGRRRRAAPGSCAGGPLSPDPHLSNAGAAPGRHGAARPAARVRATRPLRHVARPLRHLAPRVPREPESPLAPPCHTDPVCSRPQTPLAPNAPGPKTPWPQNPRRGSSVPLHER